MGADSEDPDACRTERILWVPKQVRWLLLHTSVKQPTIGKRADDARVAIEKDKLRNPLQRSRD